MDSLQLLLVALVQGLTEFLPISSSAHLILMPKLLGWPDQGLAIDVAVHVGTLAAVVVYLSRDTIGMGFGALKLASGGHDAHSDLLLRVVLATLPVVIVGLLMKSLIELYLRSVAVIGVTTIVFGVVLLLADATGQRSRRIDEMSFADALIIVSAQVLALIPGVSRAGITITAGLYLGYERAEAARFSMLLAIPTILAAGVLLGAELYQSDDFELQRGAITAAGLSFVVALITIWLLMSWLKRASFTPFVIYRVILGVLLLGWVVLRKYQISVIVTWY